MERRAHSTPCCIVPPHILRALLGHPQEAVRAAALRTITASARLRERRRLLARLRSAVPAGGLRRTVYDAHSQEHLPGALVRGEGDNPAGDAAVNEAYDGLGATFKLYQDVFGRNSIDDQGMRLDASVHYGSNYDNAFWDGQQMVFGDGDNVIFVGFTKAIDVIGHELTHGVTEHTAALEYHQQSGALNESISDVFGSLVKQYAAAPQQTAAQADWLIGSGILAPGINGHALRSMAAPGSAYDDPKLGGRDPQPGHMNGYQDLPDTDWDDSGGVHINSGIPNHAFYLVATELGGYAWEDAGHIWYAALRQLWPSANFQDCANVTFQVAGALFGSGSRQQQAVRTAWDTVGITVATAGLRARQLAAAEEDRAGLKAQLERVTMDLQELVGAMK